jgi:hypothetical protein
MLEKLSPRDRVALKVAAAAVALFLVVQLGVLPLLDKMRGTPREVGEEELMLRRHQRLVAESTSQGRIRAAAEARLKDLESGLLESASPSLANAEWQRLMRDLADQKGLELGSSEVLRVEGLSSDYAMVLGRVQLRCRLDQLVDLLVALATSPKLLRATALKVSALQGDPQKRLQVELTIGALMRATKATAGGTDKR